MKCIVCAKWSFRLICTQCLDQIKITPSTRLVDEMSVYSFYAYSDVELLIHYKYQAVGARIYHILAHKAKDYYLQNISAPLSDVYGVGIDDCVDKGYSHNGVILKAFQEVGICPIYGQLIAKNQIRYAGKTLQYRKDHPKNFQSSVSDKQVVLFDDIITTGTSLKEAKHLLEKQNNQVLFALTLCNARL
ncbi:hypothetical protein BBW65_02340 [Helicobacter enhydrae]|uniref:Phosphoribosyltransferase domain-containing protein n=1 Tax=Helicobacter enhydrae TaxID=222136 RepID=A0A1B1U4J0_9HELI|nr:phosphoribosyltransferase family protein [Helicobacter enhydrae]ANV97714.1 hypothetical protein BBW65_02340 [Helicobacter enhydrae]